MATVISIGRTAVQQPDEPQVFGVTFAPRVVRFYGDHDPLAAFFAVVNDLGVRDVRFPIYWNATEPEEGAFDFSDIDPYLEIAAAHGVRVTLVVGMKVPRWPECHVPVWVTDDLRSEALFAYIKTLVVRYKDHPAVVRWQVENEQHFPFGECPVPDLDLYAEEIALVRRLDPDTPIQLTVSGEQELWAGMAEPADILGTSLYRFAWNPVTGLVVFPHPPEFYRLQALAVAQRVERVVISELQAEPWFEDGVIPVERDARYALFTADRLKDHLAFARRTGLPEVYLWGVEWWYDLAQRGDTRLWDAVRGELQESN